MRQLRTIENINFTVWAVWEARAVPSFKGVFFDFGYKLRSLDVSIYKPTVNQIGVKYKYQAQNNEYLVKTHVQKKKS